jgi:putative lipoic acid-binding regulatory protein
MRMRSGSWITALRSSSWNRPIFSRESIAAVYIHLAAHSDLDYSVRTTPTGRHLALTLDITVQTAEQVRAIYAEIREVEGLTLLF